MILVDTNIIIDYWKSPDEEKTEIFYNNEIAICHVIKAELIHGAKSHKEKVEIEDALSELHILPINEETWNFLGEILFKLKKSGITVPFQDALIAAVAIENNCLLWTNDKHFSNISTVINELKLFGDNILMNEKASVYELNASRELLEQLIEEVKIEEGTLSGGTSLGIGTDALQQLRETKISFGNPLHNLIRLTEEGLSKYGIELSEIQKQQMRDRFDFYYMTLSVSLQPGRGVQFTRLECLLDFGPKGQDEPIVNNIFPQSEWREVLRLGRKMSLGLDGNLEWRAGMDDLDKASMEKFPAAIKGKITNKNELKAFIAIPDYSYELGRADIAATGAGNSQCFWRVDKPDLKKAQTVQFGIVFKVPKETSSFELTGMVSVEPNFQWLTSNLKDVFEFLSDKIKGLLRLKEEERKGKDRLPIGDHEKWEITLP